MKKKLKIGDYISPPLKKVLMVMKLSAILIFFLAFQLSASVYSQQTKLSLELNGMSIRSVLQVIESQSRYKFLLQDELIDIDRKIDINVTDESITTVLEKIFSGQNVRYVITEKNLVIINPNTNNYEINSSQQKNVSGKITDSAGMPLPGVSVVIKGTAKGIISDANGNYSINNISANSTLVFSFVGMKTQEINVTGKTNFNVVMREETVGIDEVVAIGYGTQKKASLTGAIANMKTDRIVNIPTSNLSNVLAGRMSGTLVLSSTGTPGTSSSIRVRQNGSWNTAEALYVVDGVVRDKTSFDALDPNEVEDITVLKDAASTAIYGSRAGNGVVLVTTKQGKSGSLKIEYSSVFATEKVGKLPRMLSPEESLRTTQRIYGGVSEEEIQWVLDNNPDGMNMYNAAYSDPNTQKHSVGVSGGNDKVTYFLGGSFFDENGFLPNVWYKKYNLRANVSAKVSKDLTVGLNISNSYGTRNRFAGMGMSDSTTDIDKLWGVLLYWNMWLRPYIDGKPVDCGWIGNPVETMRKDGTWNNKNQLIDALINIKYDVPFIKGLSLSASYSRNIDNSFIKDFAKKHLLYTFKQTGEHNLIYTDELIGTTMSNEPSREYIGNRYSKSDAYQFNGQITFDRHFGKHYVNATAVYEQYEYYYNDFSMYRYNFDLLTTDQFFAASKDHDDWSTNGWEDQNARLSYVGRVNYEYDGKYFLSSSARYDGSIKFAPDKRWGFFPSVSSAWMISKENFFQDSKLAGSIDMLKLRASFGTTGNDGIGGWQWLEQYNVSSGSYFLGQSGTSAPLLTYGGTPNPDLTWETTRSYNLGLDMRLLKNIDFTFEFWKSRTVDILGSRSLVLPTEFGASLPASNYGKAEAKGIEIELSYRNKIGNDFSYSVSGNIGFATTKTILKDHSSNGQWFDNPEGKTRTYGTGYQNTGIIRTQAELDALPEGYTIFGAKPELGMMNFADLSGSNNTPDGKIDGYDRKVIGKYIGSGSAPVTYGLDLNIAYKNFSVDALFAGSAGFRISYNDPWGRALGGNRTQYYHADSWTVDNPNGSTPKLYTDGDSRSQGYLVDSYYNVTRGDFLRLKNLQLGYNIPKSILKITGLNEVKVFASGTNLFCLTKFKFYDPEINGFMSYPNMKTYSVGLNVQF